MSNPETFYLTINNNNVVQDLSGIFQPISLGTSYPTETGFKLSNGQDLNTIFANISSGSSLGYNVGYKISNGNDLSQIFAKYDNTSFTYTITNQTTNMNVTTITYNNYTGLIFENTSVPSTTATSATCNISFNTAKSINILAVGGSGGGAAGNSGQCSGAGSGGGGFINTTFNTNVNSIYSISVGSGGSGRKATNPGGGESAGYVGADSSFSLSPSLDLIAYAGQPGYGVGSVDNFSGGYGGSASNNLNNTGGGGGGGGGGLTASVTMYNGITPSNPIIGALNTSYNYGNRGGQGDTTSLLPYRPGIYGGDGGNAYYNTITPPFLSTGSIYFGNGGGGGSTARGGGKAGSTSGGTGFDSTLGNSGEDAIYGLSNGNYFYGNGGGGGSTASLNNNYGGNGGNGVVILWW
jgi:hypothetical protein